MAGMIKSITIKSAEGLKLINIKRVKNAYEVETLSSLSDMNIIIIDDMGRTTIPIRRKP